MSLWGQALRLSMLKIPSSVTVDFLFPASQDVASRTSVILPSSLHNDNGLSL